ncbi:1-phosphofructokinase [Dongshaea marina]|uniref:1-phosphofructokinase n=1 Tax=Dongshaea marina TaxID=2047966 RepID=UPI000D3EDA4A|nr:1-phosphofructokinase [Dongshaea marina]
MSVLPAIVTVTLNPALDLTGYLGQFMRGRVNQIERSTLGAAGKGVNVAQVLARLGARVTATGLLGQDNQGAFCELFERTGIEDQFVRLAGSTRINVKLSEQGGEVSDLNFPGFQVTDEALNSFENKLLQLASDHQWFVFSGSLPRGLSAELVAGWIGKLVAQGKRVLFDSSGPAFARGIEQRPWLIKPNEEELGQWLGKPLSTETARAQAAHRLQKMGIEHVVVSQGAEGVLWFHRGQCLQATPPKMQVQSTVGAGDSLVAALCWGLANGWSQQECLRFATGLSAQAVTHSGVAVWNDDDLNRLIQEVCVESRADLQGES